VYAAGAHRLAISSGWKVKILISEHNSGIETIHRHLVAVLGRHIEVDYMHRSEFMKEVAEESVTTSIRKRSVLSNGAMPWSGGRAATTSAAVRDGSLSAPTATCPSRATSTRGAQAAIELGTCVSAPALCCQCPVTVRPSVRAASTS
jgi:hypothetical protein